MFQPFRDAPDQESEDETSDGKIGDTQESFAHGWSPSLDHHGKRKIQGQKPCCIVHQAFCLQNVDNPLRQTNPFRDGRRGDGIRGRHDRAKNKSQSQIKTCKNPAGNFGDS